jgi:hypothetical protein
MKKLYESFIKRRDMLRMPLYRKTVAPLYFADTYGFAIRGYRIKRGVAL